MKKIFALGMALAMIASLCACSIHIGKDTAAAEDTPAEEENQIVETQTEEDKDQTPDESAETVSTNRLAGFFNLVEIQSEDVSETASTEDIELMKSLGLLCYIELSEDGQANFSMFGENITGTWEDDVIFLDGEEIPIVLDGDTLTLTQENTTLIFVRTDEEDIKSATGMDFQTNLDSQTGYVENSELTRARMEDFTYAVEGDGILIDDDECRVTVTGYDPSGEWGFTVELNCENKTEDETLIFSTSEARVNGYAIDPFWTETVSAGKQANTTIEFDNEELDEAGISSVDEIILSMTVYAEDNWFADDIANEIISLYPTSLSADEVVVPDRTTSDNEQVLVDNDDVSFVILEAEEDSFWGYTIKCFVENKTDNELDFSWEDVSVNGIMLDPYWSDPVPANAREYVEIDFYNTELEENNIDTIEEIEFSLLVSDYYSWDYLLDETFTYEPLTFGEAA